MSEMADKHWTHDETLVERFILNTMNPEERNELEDHLRICEPCKREVRSQQLLIAGIQRSGREALKERLREQTASLPERQIPWPHILSAAAVILILLSVGIYNRWFETVKQPENTFVLVHPDAAPPVISKDSVEKSPSTMTDAPLDDKSTQMAERSSRLSKQKKEIQTPTGSGLSEVMVEDKSSSTESSGNAQGAGAVSKQAESAQVVACELLVSEPEVVWTEGTALRSEDDRGNILNRGISQTYSSGKTDAMTSSPTSAQKKAGNKSSIVLIQQSVASIPLNQQQVRQPDKVITKVERLGDQIQFTVYLDSLLDESDLARTTIEPAGHDSVIVNLPNQRLRYKLPDEWRKQLLAKPTK